MANSWLNTGLRGFLMWLTANPISAIGAVLVVGGAILLIVFTLVFTIGSELVNPYFGALGFLGLPSLIVAGLGLVGVGKVIFKGKGGEEPFWVQNFNIEKEEKAFAVFGVLTALLVVFLGVSGVQAASFMDSTRFCGETCHSVMEPEAVSHSNSEHATVPCVQCHIGEGVHGAIVAKMRGAWQVIALALDHYERPIPAPVATLPSSEDTCQRCHNTALPPSPKLDLFTTYRDDETSSAQISAIAFKTGSSKPGGAHGIHAHSSNDLRIRYYTLDPKRDSISWVEAKTPTGSKIWAMEGKARPVIEKIQRTSKGRPIYVVRGEGEMREMDCVDCHNRTGHSFPRVESVADKLLASARIDPTLPYAKLVAVKSLEAAASGAKEEIADRVSGEVFAAWPTEVNAPEIATAIAGEAAKYLYPRMNIYWGAYQSENRHSRDEGCFRCHNQRMKDSSGNSLSQDCDYCHETIADHIPAAEWRNRLSPPSKREAHHRVDGGGDGAPNQQKGPILYSTSGETARIGPFHTRERGDFPRQASRTDSKKREE